MLCQLGKSFLVVAECHGVESEAGGSLGLQLERPLGAKSDELLPLRFRGYVEKLEELVLPILFHRCPFIAREYRDFAFGRAANLPEGLIAAACR